MDLLGEDFSGIQVSLAVNQLVTIARQFVCCAVLVTAQLND